MIITISPLLTTMMMWYRIFEAVQFLVVILVIYQYNIALQSQSSYFARFHTAAVTTQKLVNVE